jgi:hypothetical protein
MASCVASGSKVPKRGSVPDEEGGWVGSRESRIKLTLARANCASKGLISVARDSAAEWNDVGELGGAEKGLDPGGVEKESLSESSSKRQYSFWLSIFPVGSRVDGMLD